MERLEGAGDLAGEVEQIAAMEAFAAENGIERFSFHQLANDEVLILGGGQLVEARQIRLTDGGYGGYRFLNAAALVGISRQSGS